MPSPRPVLRVSEVVRAPADADEVEVELPAADCASTTAVAVPALAAAAAPADVAAPPRSGRLDYRWIAMLVVLGGSIMTILDATVVNVAISTLQRDFHVASYSDIAWVVTGYMLAQGAVIPMTGWVTDRYGTKRVYLITLALFTAASALCGLAPNLGMLIVFRILQGVGGGMLMPIGLTIILQAFGPSQMGRVMGIFGVPTLLAPAVGPLLGGWLTEDFSWRLIFFVNVPIGAVSIVAAWLLLRETPYTRRLRLDAIGLATGVPAVLALMYGVDRSTELGWGAPLVLSMLVASAVLFTVFVVRQLTAEEPLLHIRLFKDTTFTMSTILSLVVVTGLFGVVYLLPLFLQQVRGYDAITTGLLLMPQAATAAVLMPISGQLTDRFGPRWVVMFGLVFLVISSVMLTQVHADTSAATIVWIMALRGVAMGFAMMPAMSAGLARIPKTSSSRASSITNTVQRAGSSVAIAVLVTVLATQTATAATQAGCAPSPQVLAAAAQVEHSATPPTAPGLCAQLRSQASSIARGQASGPSSTGNPTYDAFVTAYRDDSASITFDRTFGFVALVAALGLIPAWFLRRPDPDTGVPGGGAG